VGVPTLTPLPVTQPSLDVSVAPPEVPEPAKIVIPVVSEAITPAPAATSEPQWQPLPEQPTVPGTWTKPHTPDGAWQPGATNHAPRTIARAQAGQTQQADPIVTLIQTLCRHRATDVEVRYIGTKKLSVCFEVRGEADAIRLVKDISSRKELFAFQIGFCVLVK
jgi:hypothetical protein